jgi:hypothetical protein
MRISAILILGACAALTGCMTEANKPAQPAPVATAPAGSKPPAPAPGATKQAASSDPNQIVCMRIENTGSRLATDKECHTRAEWVQMRSTGVDAFGIVSAAHLPTTDGGSMNGR